MLNFKSCLRGYLPEVLKKPIRIIRRFFKELVEFPDIYLQPYRHKKALNKVRKKSKNNKIKVAFFATHSSVWKYDGVYKLLDQDERFEPIVVVCPVVDHGNDNMVCEMDKAFNAMQTKGYNVIKTYKEEDSSFLDVKKELSPDIIFFTNPHRLTSGEYYITNYKDTLSCYVQYSIHVTNLYESNYNQIFHNLLWRFFCETEIHHKMARENARNKGRNIMVSGYPGTDDFLYGYRSEDDVWKNPNSELKRIIWAPHHTLDLREKLGFSNFLRYHQFMLDLCDKYKEKIQIAFKPHPLLKIKLYEHEKWGQQRTDDYYNKWKNLGNGQVETDDYVKLFNSSDAMILDSGSFVAEYLYCGKPSLFTFANTLITDKFNEFGKMALETHYHAYDEKQMVDFIDNVVCNEKDTLMEIRNNFYLNYLIPYNKQSASLNIYDSICSEIWGINLN